MDDSYKVSREKGLAYIEDLLGDKKGKYLHCQMADTIGDKTSTYVPQQDDLSNLKKEISESSVIVKAGTLRGRKATKHILTFDVYNGILVQGKPRRSSKIELYTFNADYKGDAVTLEQLSETLRSSDPKAVLRFGYTVKNNTYNNWNYWQDKVKEYDITASVVADFLDTFKKEKKIKDTTATHKQGDIPKHNGSYHQMIVDLTCDDVVASIGNINLIQRGVNHIISLAYHAHPRVTPDSSPTIPCENIDSLLRTIEQSMKKED